MRIHFQEISVSATFHWKENGKSRQVTKKFFQTISPFNTTCQGSPKTKEQILKEINRERDYWLIEQRKLHEQAA
jgi:hypothetical protein